MKDYMLPYDSTRSPTADTYYKTLESLLRRQYFKGAVRHCALRGALLVPQQLEF